MATDKQIAANRRNALMSTGPRSLAGKRKSSLNALKHGLTTTQTTLPGEDPVEFSQMRAAMFSSLYPQGVLENQLVERMASLIWRLRRVQAFEAALFEWMAYYQAAVHDVPNEDLEIDSRRNDPVPNVEEPIHDLQDRLRLGRMIEAVLGNDLTTKLTYYEERMQRQLSAVMRDFNERQKARAAMNAHPAEHEDDLEADNDEYIECMGKLVKRIGPP